MCSVLLSVLCRNLKRKLISKLRRTIMNERLETAIMLQYNSLKFNSVQLKQPQYNLIKFNQKSIIGE